MENLLIATNAVIPFVVYILLGMLAKRSGAVKESFLKELNGVVFKVFFPFIMFNNLYAVDFSRLSNAFYVVFATPVAAASYPMAQSMGGDADLAGEYVVISTLLSIFTIFGWILLLKNMALI